MEGKYMNALNKIAKSLNSITDEQIYDLLTRKIPVKKKVDENILVNDLLFLAKGKALPPGTKRTHGEIDMVKQPDGSWSPAKKNRVKKSSHQRGRKSIKKN